MRPQVILCSCNLFSLVGCDFLHKVPIWIQIGILISSEFYKNVKSMFLGMVLELIHQLFTHPALHSTLQSRCRQESTTSLIESHHNKESVHLSNAVIEDDVHSWWCPFWLQTHGYQLSNPSRAPHCCHLAFPNSALPGPRRKSLHQLANCSTCPF